MDDGKLVISFEYVTGRHTALNIKKQYDIILERFGLTDKVCKVVAANIKKALEKKRIDFYSRWCFYPKNFRVEDPIEEIHHPRKKIQ